MEKLKNCIMNDKRKFAKGMSFPKMYLIFVICSFLGVVYEEIIGFIKYHHATGIWFWPNRQGVIYGPFNPLYGAGIVLILIVLGRKKRPYLKTWLYGGLLGGIIEYTVSFLMELVLGVASWDYSNRPLNINGRTTLIYMIFWGFAIMVLIHFIYPHASKWIEKIPYKIGNFITIVLVIFMTFDMIISWTALGRQTLRHKGHPPFTFIGEFYDKVYTDEYLKKVYTNMKIIK